MVKEFDFLNIISKKLDDSSFLGDDCAFLREQNLVVSSDSFVEDVHFGLKYMSVYEIAKKAMLVNISDILASGGRPIFASINLSGLFNDEFISEFYDGINDVAKEYNIKIIGGDLTKAEKIFISITIFGDTRNRNISSRKNAKKDYIVAVCGEFGSSANGLKELLEGKKDSYFINCHKIPKLYKEVSNFISLNSKKPYAMMDSSDGLCDCLIQIAQKSCVKIEVDYSLIPKKTQIRDYVLYGGEDYSLVCCLDKNDFEKNEDLVKIGSCKFGDGVYIDGKKIEHKGYNHFE